MLQIPLIFSDHMVLQRHKPIAVWGRAAANTQVQVMLLQDQLVLACGDTVSKQDGRWLLHLPPMEAKRDLLLKIESDGQSITYNDVLIGEVWIAGGQSNMEYLLYFDAEKELELIKPENPDIRFFDYPKVSYEEALNEYDFTEFGFWRKCNQAELPWFSAVGYYFAVKLQESLGVPVGIVGCNWGGTRACSWMGEEYLENNAGAVWLEDYQNNLRGVDLVDYSRFYRSTPGNIPNHPIPGSFPQITYPGLTREQQLEAMGKLAQTQYKYDAVIGPDHPWRPCGLYHTMLEKIVPYTAEGVLWYQGESDEVHPDIYDQVLSNLIQNWRDIWEDELPFLIVQLAPFEAWFNNVGTHYPILRKCQKKVADTVPNVYLCSNSDGGMRWDIHPKHKRPVGERLALLARGHIYGEDFLCDAPALDSITLIDQEAVLYFRNAKGLHLKDDCSGVNALLVNGAPTTGRIEDDALIIPLPEGERWVIEFANTDYYEVNLYNAANIPAIPFAVALEKE